MRPHTGRARSSGSSGEPRLGAGEKRLAAVERRGVDHFVEQLGQRLPECRARPIAELDQVGAVDCEVREAVRAAAFMLDESPEATEPLELVLVARPVLALADQVGLLVREEIDPETIAVAAQQPPRAERVGAADVEHVEADDPDDALAQLVRIAQATERRLRELRADVGVVAPPRPRVEVEPAIAAPPRDLRLAEIVKKRRQAKPKRVTCTGRRLHDRAGVLVDGEGVIPRLLIEADRRLELGQELDEDAGVARDLERAARLGAQEQARDLTHAAPRQPAADALARDDRDRAGLLAHLPQRLVVGGQADRRTEARPAHEPERVLREADRRHGPKASLAQVALPAERIDELAVVEMSRHGVDREVAPGEVVPHACRRVDDDLEGMAARPRRTLPPWRRELDPGGRAGADVPVSREEADADRLAGDDEVLDAAVWL